MPDAPFPDGMLASIERFLDEDVAPRGRDLYPLLFDTDLFFPLQRQEEMRRMMQIARTIQPRVVAELGCDKGGGLWHWVKSHESIKRAIGCEVRGTPYSNLLERAFPDVDFLWLPNSSYDPQTLREARTWLGDDTIDCLFIDGDKGATLQDFFAWLPMMSEEGIVFIHDINEPGEPLGAFQMLQVRGFRHESVVNLEDTHLAQRREAQGLRPRTPHEGWLRHWAGRSAGVGVIYLGEKR